MQEFERVCPMCGDTFKTNNSRQKYCLQDKEGICPICGRRYTYKCRADSAKTCGDPRCNRLISSNLKPKKGRICAGCGRQFVAEEYRSAFCGETLTATCKVCGKEFSFVCNASTVSRDTCLECLKERE